MLTKEQVDEVMRGLDIILVAIGAPSMAQLIKEQENLVTGLPPEQAELVMKGIMDGANADIANMMAASIESFTKQLKGVKHGS